MRKLSDTAWRAITILLGFMALLFVILVTPSLSQDRIPVPVPVQEGWYTVRDDKMNTYQVRIAPDGYGVMRDDQTGKVYTFDTNNGTWRDSELGRGV